MVSLESCCTKTNDIAVRRESRGATYRAIIATEVGENVRINRMEFLGIHGSRTSNARIGLKMRNK